MVDQKFDPNYVFIIGSPRSGTTWLQSMLGAHPLIVTGQESHLFSAYLSPLWRAWNRQLTFLQSENNRHEGLVSYLTQSEFDALMQHIITTVFAGLQEGKPAAKFILEKTPDHTLFIDLISNYLPGARFIHLIRDGRDVAVSLMRISRTWGRKWAPARVRDAAWSWKRYVLAGRSASAFSGRYMELRYEDLLGGNGPEQLKRTFDFMGIPCTLAEVGTIYEENRFETAAKDNRESKSIVRSGEIFKQLGGGLLEPNGFYHKGGAGGWKAEWSTLDCDMFYREAGGLLAELGYESQARVIRLSALSYGLTKLDDLRLKVRPRRGSRA